MHVLSKPRARPGMSLCLVDYGMAARWIPNIWLGISMMLLLSCGPLYGFVGLDVGEAAGTVVGAALAAGDGATGATDATGAGLGAGVGAGALSGGRELRKRNSSLA